MKFRRAVLVVLAANRLKQRTYATQDDFGYDSMSLCRRLKCGLQNIQFSCESINLTNSTFLAEAIRKIIHEQTGKSFGACWLPEICQFSENWWFPEISITNLIFREKLETDQSRRFVKEKTEIFNQFYEWSGKTRGDNGNSAPNKLILISRVSWKFFGGMKRTSFPPNCVNSPKCVDYPKHTKLWSLNIANTFLSFFFI